MIKVSVVVLNWNRADDTIECLNSLKRVDRSNFELSLIVVDNASSDNSLEKIKEFTSKNWDRSIKLKILKNSENLGFTGGNNLGIKEVVKDRDDFVLILNNDTIVHKDLIKNLVKVALENKEASCLSPKIYFAKGYEFHKEAYSQKELGKVIWYAGGVIDWKNIYGKNLGVDEVDHGQYDDIREIDFATGACMFLRVKALQEVGFFDERYFMYFEDVDLSQRIKRNNYQVLFVPNGLVWHKVGQSSKIGSDLNDYFITRNRLIFGFDYASLRTKIALHRESINFLISGRYWQKRAVVDFYFKRFGKGSWKF